MKIEIASPAVRVRLTYPSLTTGRLVVTFPLRREIRERVLDALARVMQLEEPEHPPGE